MQNEILSCSPAEAAKFQSWDGLQQCQDFFESIGFVLTIDAALRPIGTKLPKYDPRTAPLRSFPKVYAAVLETIHTVTCNAYQV